MFSLSTKMRIFLQRRTRNEGDKGMATLKSISVRLKSVKNIQKITQSMKMVSAAKFSKAERELRQARPLGEGARVFYGKIEPEEAEEIAPEGGALRVLYVAITSDRGLCGAVHSSVTKKIRNELLKPNDDARIVCIGDKARSLLHRLLATKFLFVCQEVGRVPPTFGDASIIANEILRSEFHFEKAKIVYNRFRSVVSNVTEEISFYGLDKVLRSPKIKTYEEADEETLLAFVEFSTAVLIFYAMKEGACSEQASRMTAMDNSSKNAREMISQLTLTYNRTRQAVITRELIEIISGASAL